MKRIWVLFLFCIVAMPLLTFGQNEPGFGKMTLGANFELSIPVGDFGDVAGTGYGGNVRFQYGADIHSVFTATAGYLVWGEKDFTNGTPSVIGAQSVQWKAFNIFVGGKYYFAPGFFGSLEGGLYFVSADYSGGLVSASGSSTYFMLPIGIGYQKSGIEVAARYMLLHPDFNQISFLVGYNFAL